MAVTTFKALQPVRIKPEFLPLYSAHRWYREGAQVTGRFIKYGKDSGKAHIWLDIRIDGPLWAGQPWYKLILDPAHLEPAA